MKFFLIFIILHTNISCVSPRKDDPQNLMSILKNIETKNKEIRFLYYKSSYKQVYSGRQDSIYVVNADIWLEKRPLDTIFSFVFHVKGVDNAKSYDYFYDGQNAYDIRHAEKQLTIINPYVFPNDDNNPAKARTALLPVLSYITSTNLVEKLLSKSSEYKLIEHANKWLVELKYIKDNHGIVKTRQITISKKDSMISEFKEDVLWNGVHISSSFIITNVSINNQNIASQIPLLSTFSTYTVQHYESPKKTTSKNILIGKIAPKFKYPSFKGGDIELIKLKGKYVLLDFWESWCGNCILALPKLKELHVKYGNRGLQILGITTGNQDQVSQIIRKNNLSYTNLLADQTIIANYSIVPRPTYVLIDPSGIIIQYSSNLDEIKSFIVSIESLK